MLSDRSLATADGLDGDAIVCRKMRLHPSSASAAGVTPVPLEEFDG